MFNLIWSGLIIVAILGSCINLMFGHNSVNDMVTAMFGSAETSVKIAIGLSGLLCLWMGIAQITQASGLINILARILSPIFKIIMPSVPADHKAISSITMNIAANMLGLDNAATPMGIKAMNDLQELNPNKTVASDAQIMFLVINTSAITLFPVSIFMYRMQMGAANPTDVFIPLLLATSCSTLAGFIVTSFVQKIPLLRIPVLVLFLLFISFVGSIICWGIWAGSRLTEQSTIAGNLVLLILIAAIFIWAMIKKVNVFDSFITGAKDGFKVSIDILPYLVAMLFAIALFRSSGVLDVIIDGIKYISNLFFSDIRFVDALPVSIIKPLSGSGARAMMIDVMQTFGADSLQGHIASIMQGSTETTFYVLAVYFGSVGIVKVRHAIFCGLCADCASMIASIVLGYMFFA